ncbi:GNAT family N-acetyltransferase [Enterocloster clostridioformis]|uniref:GNAT family N-acetyltransferase n=1 Tax=Enterocloster clostridioformis TaxID=1531 RepID=UPI001FA82306
MGKGYGKQIVMQLIQYCKKELRVKEFIYSTRDNNEASKRLARSLGFELIRTEEKIDEKDGRRYILQTYSLKL